MWQEIILDINDLEGDKDNMFRKNFDGYFEVKRDKI